MGNALMLDRRGGGGANLKFITATASDILLDKIGADQKGKQVVGTMPNNGAVAPEALAAGESYPIPEGYHDGNGQVAAKDLASQTEGNAAAELILSGYTAWVNGSKITGSMEDNRSTTSNGTVPGMSQTYPAVPTREGTNLQLTTSTDGVARISICPPKGYYPGPVNDGSYVNRPASEFGNANRSNVLSGATFTSKNGLNIAGSMGNYSGKTSTSNYVGGTFRSGTTGYVFASPGSNGYYTTGSYIRIPANNLAAGNIKKGVSILGITGTFEGYATSPLYLFNNGTWSNLQTTGITQISGLTSSDDSNGSIRLGAYANTSIVGFARLNQTVNISNYNYLKITAYSSNGYNDYFKCGVGISTNASASAYSSLTSYTTISLPDSTLRTVILDISSKTGSYYIYLMVTAPKTGSFYFKSIFLSTT